MSRAKSLVYGGCYRETCITPHHDQLMGSGLRACLALSKIAGTTAHIWHSWISASDRLSINGVLANSPNVHFVEYASGKPAQHTPSFHYLNPLARPVLAHDELQSTVSPQKLAADSALVFGTLESRPCVFADTVVYDPQCPDSPDLYFDNGSTASRCALVLNHKEATRLACDKDIYAATKLLQSYLLRGRSSPYEVIVVKMAHAGCWVCTRDEITPVPAYQTKTVFSIGSGDVFSAAFYAKWALENTSPVHAATFASQVTSNYCEAGIISSDITLTGNLFLKPALPVVNADAPAHKKQIYLAAPFFNQGEIAFVEHLRDVLTTPWTTVFSPFHDVGCGGPEDVYKPDIKGLEESDLVFAVLSGLDTGTIFEVGFASKIPKPVFCLAEAVASSDLTMILGSGAVVETDITTAVYKALWATLD